MEKMEVTPNNDVSSVGQRQSHIDWDWQQHHEFVASRNSVLLQNNLWSDIEFYFENENITIPAHRIIIAASSNVLAAMAFGGLHTNRINIVEIPSKCISEVLRYIYTDTVDITTENSACIMYAAHKYNIKLLEEKCIKFIESDMKLENACIYFDSLVFDNEINDRCMKIIKTQTNKILETNAFLELSLEKLTKLLKCHALNATEVQLYQGMLKWVENACKQDQITPTTQNKRILLQNAERWIRFPAMTLETFSECVRIDSEFLSKIEIGELIMGIFNNKNESQFFGGQRKVLSKRDFCNEHISRPLSYDIDSKLFDETESDGIELKSKCDIILNGFGVCGIKGDEQKVNVSIMYAETCDFTEINRVITKEINCNGDCKIYKIMLDEPIKLIANNFKSFCVQFDYIGLYYYNKSVNFDDDFNILTTQKYGDCSNGRIFEIYFDTK